MVYGKQLEDYSAVQLFLDRARRKRGDFDLAEDERGVVEICRVQEFIHEEENIHG